VADVVVRHEEIPALTLAGNAKGERLHPTEASVAVQVP
jgi:hypothetical protein